MNIIIQKQFKEKGVYSEEEEVRAEITREDDEILLEVEIESIRLIIPLEAFIGILS